MNATLQRGFSMGTETNHVALLELVCPRCRMVWGLPLERWKRTTVESAWSCPEGHVAFYPPPSSAPANIARREMSGAQAVYTATFGPAKGPEHEKALEHVAEALGAERIKVLEARTRIRELEEEIKASASYFRCPVHGCDFKRKRAHMLRTHLYEAHGWRDMRPPMLPANAGPDADGQGS